MIRTSSSALMASPGGRCNAIGTVLSWTNSPNCVLDHANPESTSLPRPWSLGRRNTSFNQPRPSHSARERHGRPVCWDDAVDGATTQALFSRFHSGDRAADRTSLTNCSLC